MPGPLTVSARQRKQMIAESAYFAAQKQEFRGNPVNHWLEAEAQVDARLRALERERLLERVDEIVDAASQRVSTLRNEGSKLAKAAKSDWNDDIEQLVGLRDELRDKAKEIRDLGAAAGTRVLRQAEALRARGVETLHRMRSKAHG